MNDQDAHILYTHDSAVKKELKNAAQAHTRTRLTEWLWYNDPEAEDDYKTN